MRKSMLIVMAIVASVAAISNANAEFVVGAQLGANWSDATVEREVFTDEVGVDTYYGNSSRPIYSNGSDTSIGLFGQYRHTLSNNMFLGVHLGYAEESAEWGRKYAFQADRAYPVDNPVVAVDDYVSGFVKYEADDTFDFLGLVGYKGEKVNPFAMFGFSQMSIKSSAVETNISADTTPYAADDDDTLDGWKLAVGVEFPFSDAVVGHVQFHYADYGEVSLFDAEGDGYSTRDLAIKHQGIRFGIGYTF